MPTPFRMSPVTRGVTPSSAPMESYAAWGVSLSIDPAPAYDVIESLSLVARPARSKRWRDWAEQASRSFGDERPRLRLWFGGASPVGRAYLALIPLLPHPHGLPELLDGITDLSTADFLRVAVTASLTDPETPLDAADLLSLAHDRGRARPFVDRYLRRAGRERAHLLWIVTNPDTARAELLALLRLHGEGTYARIERETQDERDRAAVALRALVSAPPPAPPPWLTDLRAAQGFAPVVLAPSAFRDARTGVYYHETRHPLFDHDPVEPFILLVSAQASLGVTPTRRGAPPRPDASIDPVDRWAALFGALADASRLRLLHLLMERPWYGQELATALDMSGAAISHHMGVLTRAGLVHVERRAHRTYVVLQEDVLAPLLGESGRYLLDPSRQQSRDEGDDR